MWLFFVPRPAAAAAQPALPSTYERLLANIKLNNYQVQKFRSSTHYHQVLSFVLRTPCLEPEELSQTADPILVVDVGDPQHPLSEFPDDRVLVYSGITIDSIVEMLYIYLCSFTQTKIAISTVEGVSLFVEPPSEGGGLPFHASTKVEIAARYKALSRETPAWSPLEKDALQHIYSQVGVYSFVRFVGADFLVNRLISLVGTSPDVITYADEGALTTRPASRVFSLVHSAPTRDLSWKAEYYATFGVLDVAHLPPAHANIRIGAPEPLISWPVATFRALYGTDFTKIPGILRDRKITHVAFPVVVGEPPTFRRIFVDQLAAQVEAAARNVPRPDDLGVFLGDLVTEDQIRAQAVMRAAARAEVDE